MDESHTVHELKKKEKKKENKFSNTTFSKLTEVSLLWQNWQKAAIIQNKSLSLRQKILKWSRL